MDTPEIPKQHGKFIIIRSGNTIFIFRGIFGNLTGECTGISRQKLNNLFFTTLKQQLFLQQLLAIGVHMSNGYTQKKHSSLLHNEL